MHLLTDTEGRGVINPCHTVSANVVSRLAGNYTSVIRLVCRLSSPL